MLNTDVVAKRALCLGLMVLRAQAENGISYIEDQSERYRQFGNVLLEWADRYDVTRSLSNNERELHAKPLGEWEYDDIFEVFWRVEALKSLLWAIGYIPEMPTYFDVGNPNDVYSLIPFNQSTQAFLDHSQLRAEDRIEGQRHKAQFLNWRARTEVFRLRGLTPPLGDSYDAVVRRALDGIEKEGIEVLHDGIDLLIDGCRFIDLDGETKGNIASICTERHLALEWICSDDEDWDNAYCDT
jgi:hypothetical protein